METDFGSGVRISGIGKGQLKSCPFSALFSLDGQVTLKEGKKAKERILRIQRKLPGVFVSFSEKMLDKWGKTWYYT